MVCGTRLAKPHDMRRHTLTHYRVFLRAITAAHQKTCPLCNTTIKHSDKYLFHYFLTHRKFYNVEALPEQVKRHIGRSIESNLAHNQRYPLKIAESTVALEDDQDYTYSDMGQGYDEGDQIGEEGDTELDEGEDDASKLQYEGEHDSQEEEPEDASDGDEEVPVEVNPGSDDENEGEGVESDDFNGAADINSYPCGDCEQKTPVSKWQDHLYAHFQNEIKETYPLDSLSCDICDQAFQDDDDLWKHLAFQHIR